jgi:hypothetical protein
MRRKEARAEGALLFKLQDSSKVLELGVVKDIELLD